MAVVMIVSLSLDGNDKAVTASLQVFDVFGSELSVSQRLAERRQMNAKAPFFDGNVGPCLRDQFVLADDLPSLVIGWVERGPPIRGRR